MALNRKTPDFSTIKNLSHIFLDGEIGGGPLDEGSTLETLLPFLTQFMTWLEQEKHAPKDVSLVALAKKSFGKTTVDGLKILLENFQYMHATQLAIQNAHSLEMLTDIAKNVCKKLSQTHDVFIPGGWTGKGVPGHAMTYRLIRDAKTGKMVFSVFNTGAGLQYHGSTPLPSGEQGYSPVFGFKFDYSPAAEEKIIIFLTMLFQARAIALSKDKESYNAEKLYLEVIVPAMPWLNAEMLTGDELPELITGQRDGVCVAKSCTKTMQAQFESKLKFREFFLAYRLFLLDIFVDKKEIETVENSMPGYRVLLKRCLGNTARMLDPTVKSENCIQISDDTIKQAIIERLNKYEKIVNKTAAKKNIHPRISLKENNPEKINKFNLRIDSVAETKSKHIPVTYKPGKQPFFTELKLLNELLRSGKLTEQASIENIERFCFAYVGEDKLFTEIVSSDSIVSELEELLKTVQAKQPMVTPRSAAVNLCLMYFMDKLCEEGAIVAKNVKLHAVGEYSSSIVLGMMQRICANPFFATQDVQLDYILLKVLAFYEWLDETRQKNATFEYAKRKRFTLYSDIIQQAPGNEKNIIKTEWQIQQSQEPKLAGAMSAFLSSHELPDEFAYCYGYLNDKKNSISTPVLDKLFKLQVRIERYVSSICDGLVLLVKESYRIRREDRIKKERLQNRGIYLRFLEYSRGFIHLGHPLSDSGYFVPRMELLKNQYKLTNKAISNALQSCYDANNFNSSQLSFVRQKSTFSDKDFLETSEMGTIVRGLLWRADEDRLENKLHTLHLNPDGLVILLLSELLQQPTWLIDEEFQQFIELSIFRPGSLLKTLQVENGLWELLDKLFSKNHFKDDPACPEAAEWFVLKLAAKISGYVLDASSSLNITDTEENKLKCRDWQDKLLIAVNTRLKDKPTLEEAREYHSLRIFALLHLEPLSPTRIQELVESYLVFMLLPASEKVGHVLEEERIYHLLEKSNEILLNQTKKSNIDFSKLVFDILMPLLKENKINTEGEWKVRFEFPLMVISDKNKKDRKIEIDFLTRTILYLGKMIGYPPRSLTSSKEYQLIFGQDLSLAGIDEVVVYGGTGKCFLLNRNGQQYKFIKCSHSELIVLKIIAGNSYQLATPHHAFGDRGLDKEVPSLFNQADHWFWIKDKNNYHVEVGHQLALRYQMENGVLYKIDFQGSKKQVISKGIPPVLKRLEVSCFIECLREKDNTPCEWHLPRYSLKFIEGENGTLKTEDGRYSLQIPAATNDTFGSGVILKPADVSDKSRYLIPSQPYFRMKNAGDGASIEYDLIHDLGNDIPENIIYNIELKQDTKHRYGWKYEASEHCVEYAVDENEYKAKNAAEQFYLAYLYLVQNRPQKALKILKTVQFQGTLDEIKYLWWIIDGLPIITDSSIKPIVNPKTIAVQMHALHIIVRIKQQFPALGTIASVGAIDSETQVVRDERRKELQANMADLYKIVRKFYETYNNRRHNIPKIMQLSEDKENEILIFAQGSWEIARLNKSAEKNTEEKGKVKKELKDVPVYSGLVATRYLEQIGMPIAEAKSPAQTKGTSEVVRVTYESLALKSEKHDKGLFKYAFYPKENHVDYKDLSPERIKAAISELSPWMSDHALCLNFPVYYFLARNDDKNHKEKIKQTCYGLMSKTLHRFNKDESNDKCLAGWADENIYSMTVLLWLALHLPANEAPLYCHEILQENEKEKDKNLENIVDTLKRNLYDKLTQFPIPTLVCSEVSKTHVVTRSETKLPSIVEIESVSHSQTLDILEKFPELKELRSQLQANAAVYETQSAKLIKEMPILKELSLIDQNIALSTVDNNLLKLKKDLAEQQQAAYDVFNKKYQHKSEWAEKIQQTEQILFEKEKLVKNKISEIIEKRQRNIVSEVGKQSEKITLENLINNYTRYKDTDYAALGFNSEQVSSLRKELDSLLDLEHDKFCFNNLKKTFKKIEDKHHASKELIAALLTKNNANSKQEAVFQYIKNIGLYPQQARILKILVEKSPDQAISYLIKLIMGGGKTKVILPLLLSLLANGSCLPVVMVPDASLNTNFSDLRSTSLTTFNQDAFLLHFDREMPCEAAMLRQLYEQFETALLHKKYIVTTPVCMQSLELKYYEILYHKNNSKKPLTPEQLNEANEQLEWLGCIRRLLKKKSIVLIDEAHLLLHIRKELNYSLGVSKPINTNTTETVAAFFSWLEKIIVTLSSGEKFGLKKILRDPNCIADDKIFSEFVTLVAREMCYGENRPSFLKSLLVGSLTADDLYHYILDQADDDKVKAINNELEINPLIKARWMILREDFSNLFKSTLRNKLHENYGADIENPSNPLAIPYRANNKPTPFSFANFLESFNYTAQMIYCDGIKNDLFEALLRVWQTNARLERQDDPGVLSPTERKFNYLFKNEPNLSIVTLNLNDKEKMNYLHQKYGNHPLLVQQIVKEALETMRLDAAILRSDTLNLVAMFNKAIAFSATPENHRTYHPKIQMVYETSFLSESQVMDYLKEKQTTIHIIDSATPEKFLQQSTALNPHPTVVLDCGSRLRGISNLETVKLLEKSCQDKKYILFYQDSDLYAWKVNGGDNQTLVKLTNTDPETIETELGGTLPHERFTYLDQEHTTGVDILQAPEACAVVTVDLKTTISSFLQAVMRMRDFANKQKAVIVVDSSLKHLFGDDIDNTIKLERLFAYLEENQKKQLEIDHFSAALKKMRNLLREDADERVLAAGNPNKRDKLYKIFEDFFIEIQTDDIIELYGNKAKLLDTGEILTSCAKDQLENWIRCLKSAGVAEEEIKIRSDAVKKILNEICSESEKVCAPKNIYPPFQGNREVQQQKQQLKQAEKKIEVEKLDESQQPNYRINEIRTDWIDTLFKTGKLTYYHLRAKLVTDQYAKENWDFDENLLVSHNFLYAHEDQYAHDIFNVYTKMATAILFVKNKNNIEAKILCPEEALIFQQKMADKNVKQPCEMWLSTLNGANLTAIPELNTASKNKVNRLLEQAAFFNGRIDILSSMPNCSWLQEEMGEKFKFIQAVVKPALGIHEDQFDRFVSRFMRLDGYIYQWAQQEVDANRNDIERCTTSCC